MFVVALGGWGILARSTWNRSPVGIEPLPWIGTTGKLEWPGGCRRLLGGWQAMFEVLHRDRSKIRIWAQRSELWPIGARVWSFGGLMTPREPPSGEVPLRRSPGSVWLTPCTCWPPRLIGPLEFR